MRSTAFSNNWELIVELELVVQISSPWSPEGEHLVQLIGTLQRMALLTGLLFPNPVPWVGVQQLHLVCTIQLCLMPQRCQLKDLAVPVECPESSRGKASEASHLWGES